MKYRITLPRPNDINTFNIFNGRLRLPFTWWEFNPDLETLCLLQDLGLTKGFVHLDDVLKLAGSHSTLWIGDWQGTIAPMDVQPEGWTYPDESLLEPEWWWLWHPKPWAEKELVKGLNSDLSAAWQSASPLKALVPFQMQRRSGETTAVEAIPVSRLPDLMKKDAMWTFEFEVKS